MEVQKVIDGGCRASWDGLCEEGLAFLGSLTCSPLSARCSCVVPIGRRGKTCDSRDPSGLSLPWPVTVRRK